MKEAIDKLRELAERNEQMCKDLESGKTKLCDKHKDQLPSLLKTYRYWFQCCLIAAWLLENENEKDNQT